ncbi:hypothetical protein SCHPADRAFT_192459 [Schizopora paradoxa]|uniref:Uncharacterized protein n=1 Tax=Schizopora paradoxa TaxID=27342 RepID=A0A0H2RY09_9AGAM|nr:hypothetical protein SCHPADRAFT_192459 [Schizopora paradoxa]
MSSSLPFVWIGWTFVLPSLRYFFVYWLDLCLKQVRMEPTLQKIVYSELEHSYRNALAPLKAYSLKTVLYRTATLAPHSKRRRRHRATPRRVVSAFALLRYSVCPRLCASRTASWLGFMGTSLYLHRDASSSSTTVIIQLSAHQRQRWPVFFVRSLKPTDPARSYLRDATEY